jgi:hypothetical protein
MRKADEQPTKRKKVRKGRRRRAPPSMIFAHHNRGHLVSPVNSGPWRENLRGVSPTRALAPSHQGDDDVGAALSMP